MKLAYWIGFLTYSAVVLGIGYYVWWREKKRGKVRDNQTYWAADKSLSGWSVGLSISASMMSISWSCVYGVQLFYWYGVGAAWLLVIPWLITMAGFYWFTPLFRRLRAFSQPELLEKRFGSRARQLLAPALILVFTVWGGAEIYAAGITIAPFLGLSLPVTLFLVALIVALYSFSGGFEAVVSTDKLQFLLVALFITIMGVVGVREVLHREALGELLIVSQQAPRARPDVPSLFSPGFALIGLTFFAYLPGWLVETDVWIRLQAARTDREARKGILVAGANSLLFVGVFPLLIGLTALVLYPAEGGVIPARLQDGAFIFGALMQDFTPLWLNLLLGIGLLAASMSTVDTCGNVVALSASYDLLEPHLRGRWNAIRLNQLARGMSVLAILLAFFYALFTESLWDIFYLSSGILTTTVFLPVVAAFRKTVTPRQVHWGIVAGFLGTLGFYFLENRGWVTGIEPNWISRTGLGYILWGFLLAAAGFWGGKFFPRRINQLGSRGN